MHGRGLWHAPAAVPHASPLFALLVLVSACRGSAAPPLSGPDKPVAATTGCPPDTTQRGAGPPAADRTWCERADGTMHGPVIGFYADGRRRLEGAYAEGGKDGAWRTYYADGTLRSEEHYARGTPRGTWITYFADGSRSSEAVHRDAKTVAFRAFGSDGRKRREGTYVDGREEGDWSEWDTAGKQTVVHYLDGVRAVSTGGVIGVAECDEYVMRYTKCVAEHVPEAARSQMLTAVDATVAAWKEAAADPSARESLIVGCRAALDAGRAATTAMGCEW